MVRFACFALLLLLISTSGGIAAIDEDRIYFPDQYNELIEAERRQTRAPQAVIACQYACHAREATPQYDPVCGSDRVTYTNISKARCAIRCGKAISTRRGICSTNGPRM